jgi:hypothetical protein
MFEKRVLGRILGPKRDKVAGGWRKLHNEELHRWYCSPNILKMIKSRRIRWVPHMGETRNTYKILDAKPEAKRPLGRPRRTWEDNIKMNLRETRFGGMDWTHLAQDRDQ